MSGWLVPGPFEKAAYSNRPRPMRATAWGSILHFVFLFAALGFCTMFNFGWSGSGGGGVAGLGNVFSNAGQVPDFWAYRMGSYFDDRVWGCSVSRCIPFLCLCFELV